MQIRYGDLKKQLAEDMITFTSPFREKILELSKDETTISKIVKHGAEKARVSGAATVSEARKAIGISGHTWTNAFTTNMAIGRSRDRTATSDE